MSALTTKRTLHYLRGLGFQAEKTEHHVPRPAGKVTDAKGRQRFAFFLDRRRDLFGGIDVVAVKLGEGVIGVQSGAAGDHARHRAKMLTEPALRAWVESGARLWLISWRKAAKPGQKRKLWRPRLEELSLELFPNTNQGGVHAPSPALEQQSLDANIPGSASAKQSLPSEADPV